MPPSVFLIAIVVLAALFVLKSAIVIVPGKRARILETFGRPNTRARMPGLSFKAPWPITIEVGEVNLQLQEIGADVSVKTHDNSFMTLPVKVQYRASNDEAGAVKAHYELEDPQQQITSYVLNNVRQTAASMDMADLYQNRDVIEKQVQEALQERFIQFGYTIENVLVDQPQPSKEVEEAFNGVIASQRKKEAAANLAEAKRIELVGVAEAEKQSKKLQGEGLAEMREAIASGMKGAMQTLSDAGLTREQALSLLMDTNRLDTLGSAAQNGNLILVDLKSGSDSLAHTVGAVKAAGKTAKM